MLEHVQPCRQPDAALCTGYAPADAGTVSVNGCISAQYNFTQDNDAAEHAHLTCVALNIALYNTAPSGTVQFTPQEQHEAEARMRAAHLLRNAQTRASRH